MSNLFSRYFGMCWLPPAKSNAGVVTAMHYTAKGNTKTRRMVTSSVKPSTGPVRSRAFRNG